MEDLNLSTLHDKLNKCADIKIKEKSDWYIKYTGAATTRV